MPVRFLAKAKPFGDYPIADTEDIQHGTKRLDVALSDIETANERKADKTYVDTELAKKADSTTVSALDTRVSTNETNIAYLSNYVTPEMFGAVGDGVTDDTQSFVEAVSSGKSINLGNKTYVIKNKTLFIDHSISIYNGFLKIFGVDTESEAEWLYPYQFTFFVTNNATLTIDNINVIYDTVSGQTRSWQGIGTNKASLVITNSNFIINSKNAIDNLSLVFVHTINAYNILIDNCRMINGYKSLSGCIYNSQDAENVDCDSFIVRNCYLESCGYDEIVALWGDYSYKNIDIASNTFVSNAVDMSYMLDTYANISESNWELSGNNDFSILIHDNTFVTKGGPIRLATLRSFRGGEIYNNTFINTNAPFTISINKGTNNKIPTSVHDNVFVGANATSRILNCYLGINYVDFSDNDLTKDTSSADLYYGYGDILIKNNRLSLSTKTTVNKQNGQIILDGNIVTAPNDIYLQCDKAVITNNNFSNSTVQMFVNNAVIHNNIFRLLRAVYGALTSCDVLGNTGNIVNKDGNSVVDSNYNTFSNSGVMFNNYSDISLYEGFFTSSSSKGMTYIETVSGEASNSVTVDFDGYEEGLYLLISTSSSEPSDYFDYGFVLKHATNNISSNSSNITISSNINATIPAGGFYSRCRVFKYGLAML